MAESADSVGEMVAAGDVEGGVGRGESAPSAEGGAGVAGAFVGEVA